jgi:hypothetical protein
VFFLEKKEFANKYLWEYDPHDMLFEADHVTI